MMRAYLAAAYGRKQEIQAAAAYLELKGMEIISDWHQELYAPGIDMRTLTGAIIRGLAEKDLEQLADCDTMVFFAEPQTQQPPRGGRHVEFGIALALGKRIVVVGERENIFHHLPGITTVDSIEQVL